MESAADAEPQERGRGTKHSGADGTVASVPHPAFSALAGHDDMDQAAETTASAPGSEPSSAIARALELAAVAGQWGVVAQLGKELEARRLARAGNVMALPPAGTRRR